MKFTQTHTSKKGKYIYKIQSADREGRRVWFFIMVNPAKTKTFLNIKKKSMINLSDYGEILMSGFGDAPPQEAIDEINAQYNLEFEYVSEES